MSAAGSLRALRAFAARADPHEPCGLCGAPLAPDPGHEHLLAAESQGVLCVCIACAALFGDEYGARLRRIPKRVEELAGVTLSDADWTALNVPIRIAYFVRTGIEAGLAVYPSPAGPVRAPLTPESWRSLALKAPCASALRQDVEGLVVVDLQARRGAFRAPLDVCHRLSGLVRLHWRGLAGGEELWAALDDWLSEIRTRARELAHA